MNEPQHNDSLWNEFRRAKATGRLSPDRAWIRGLANFELSIREGPGRDIGSLVLPGITVEAEELQFFALGLAMMDLAVDKSAETPYRCIDLTPGKWPLIAGIDRPMLVRICIRTWHWDDQADVGLLGQAADEVMTFHPLTPLAGLADPELPMIGIARGQFSWLPNEIAHSDGSTMLIQCARTGMLAFGRTLVSFAINDALPELHYETNMTDSSVGRQSYELGCIKVPRIPNS